MNVPKSLKYRAINQREFGPKELVGPPDRVMNDLGSLDGQNRMRGILPEEVGIDLLEVSFEEVY
jgi:hypothetical protein